MHRTLTVVLCVRSGPTDTERIYKNKPYKADGLSVTVETSLTPGKFTGPELLQLLIKLPAAYILSSLYPLSLSIIFWDILLHGGTTIQLSSVTTPTPSKDLSNAAPNNTVKIFFLPHSNIDLMEIGTHFLHQQPPLPPPPPQPQQQPQLEPQETRAQVFMVNSSKSLLDCVNLMPTGCVLLVNLLAGKEGIDVRKDRDRYVTMGVVWSLAKWLDSVVGAVTTRDENYERLALCLGPGKKVYVMIGS